MPVDYTIWQSPSISISMSIQYISSCSSSKLCYRYERSSASLSRLKLCFLCAYTYRNLGPMRILKININIRIWIASWILIFHLHLHRNRYVYTSEHIAYTYYWYLSKIYIDIRCSMGTYMHLEQTESATRNSRSFITCPYWCSWGLRLREWDMLLTIR